MTVTHEKKGPLSLIGIDRPESRNAVDRECAESLAEAFRDFEADREALIAVLFGHGGHFCAGADLRALAEGNGNRVEETGDGPMGPTRMRLAKPVIAAVQGYAVAGGLELALWCDLRVMSETAVMGVFCRRFGVPLIDGGTVRLPRLIGQGRALDLILTGREVGAEEALRIGLVDRLAPHDEVLDAAVALAEQIAAHPQHCMLGDRASVYAQWGHDLEEAMRREYRYGLATISSGETFIGAKTFAAGAGRHGESVER